MSPALLAPAGSGGEAEAAARRRAFVVTGFVAGVLVAGVAMSVCVIAHTGTTQPSWCPFAVTAGWGDWFRAVGRAAIVGVLSGALGATVGFLAARASEVHLVDWRGRQ